MVTTDPRIDAYIEKAPAFAQPMLVRMRKAFHKGCPQVVETMKWSRPFFDHEGPLGFMAAYTKHASFGLWRAKELPDPEGIFQHTDNMLMGFNKVGTLRELPSQAVLGAYVKRAAQLNERRALEKTAPKTSKKKKKAAARPAPKAPADLLAAFRKHKRAKATFDSFPPSAKRDYVEWITSAKREATREKRLATTIEWLTEGKRRNWKYESC